MVSETPSLQKIVEHHFIKDIHRTLHFSKKIHLDFVFMPI